MLGLTYQTLKHFHSKQQTWLWSHIQIYSASGPLVKHGYGELLNNHRLPVSHSSNQHFFLLMLKSQLPMNRPSIQELLPIHTLWDKVQTWPQRESNIEFILDLLLQILRRNLGSQTYIIKLVYNKFITNYHNATH